MSSDNEVVGSALALVGSARHHARGYAGEFSPSAPRDIVELVARSGCVLEVFEFESSEPALTMPRAKAGIPIIVNRRLTRAQREFAVRHELGHVLAGELDEPTISDGEGAMSDSERVADLFALLDLIPEWVLEWLGEPDEEKARAIVRELISVHARDWEGERLEDRAKLRLRASSLGAQT